MSDKSDVFILDILMKNEAAHKDMLDIMTTLHGYLGDDYDMQRRVASGGDQVTCERQIGAQSAKRKAGILCVLVLEYDCMVIICNLRFRLFGRHSSVHLLAILAPSPFSRTN